MKTKIIEKRTEGTSYPCLKIRKETGIVIFFTEKDTGVVLDAGEDEFEVGLYDSGWNEKLFEKFEGKIELSNG